MTDLTRDRDVARHLLRDRDLARATRGPNAGGPLVRTCYDCDEPAALRIDIMPGARAVYTCREHVDGWSDASRPPSSAR